MKAAVLLLPALLLAGCTQLEGAQASLDEIQGQLEDAQAKLDEAREDAAEAKARFDRVKSATIVRSEVVRLNVTMAVQNGTMRFEATAFRGETPIPTANLTQLPAVRFEASGVSAECDPLTCELTAPSGFPITVAWADRPGERVRAAQGANLSRDDARVLVTTAAGDATA